MLQTSLRNTALLLPATGWGVTKYGSKGQPSSSDQTRSGSSVATLAKNSKSAAARVLGGRMTCDNLCKEIIIRRNMRSLIKRNTGSLT